MKFALAALLLTQQSETPNPGLLTWASFQCSIYAEMSGNEEEQERLFNVGYTVGISFLKDIENQAIPDSVISNAPIGLLMLLGGPTLDFMLGRIFDSASDDAYDAIVKTDINGFTIFDPQNWIMDDEVRSARARNKYSSSNCALIR